MPDKNLTDNEIVNEYKMYTPEECLKKIVDQHKEINRLQAENERLKGISDNKTKELLRYNASIEELHKKLETAKAEAYKECIEKVKEEINKHSYGVLHKIVINYKIDNLLKEIIGE